MSSRRWSRQAIRARRARQSARRVFRRTSRAPREPHRQPVVRVSALPQAYPGREASHGRAETSVAEERECRDSDLLAYLRSVRLPRRRERTPCRTARHVTPPAGGCGRLRHGISAKNRVHDPGRCMRSRSRRAQGASARRSGPKHSEPGRNVEPQERPIIRRSTDPFVRLVRDAIDALRRDTPHARSLFHWLPHRRYGGDLGRARPVLRVRILPADRLEPPRARGPRRARSPTVSYTAYLAERLTGCLPSNGAAKVVTVGALGIALAASLGLYWRERKAARDCRVATDAS